MEKLPAITDLYKDEQLAILDTSAKFQVLVNQPPKKEWIKDHPIAKQKDANGKEVPCQYIPVERIEWLLANIVVRYRKEVRDVKQIANSVVVTVRLHYFDHIHNEWTFHDGVGAAPLQTQSGKGAISWDFIKSNAVQIGAPAAESYALKDAAEQIGKLFGKDLNRKEVISYDALVDKYAKAMEE